MSDTRPARPSPRQPALQLHYVQLAFELNSAYACKHGYDMLYLRMRNASCHHASLGQRHPSYCKLAAIAEALARGYERVVFLDRCSRLTAPASPSAALLRPQPPAAAVGSGACFQNRVPQLYVFAHTTYVTPYSLQHIYCTI